MTTVLEVKNLVTKFYTLDGIVNAVNGVSFDLAEGETLAIVGESGCGQGPCLQSSAGLRTGGRLWRFRAERKAWLRLVFWG